MKFFSLIKDGDIHLAPGKKRIPAAEFSKLFDGETLLREAKEEALAFREEVAKECELHKQEGVKSGFEEGLIEWNKQIAYLEQETEHLREEMEKAIVPLALAAVKKIIGREIEMNKEAIVDIVSTALKAVSQHHRIAIYVHKNDLDIVEKSREHIKRLFERVDSLSIAAREDVEVGGCIIETEAGIINAKLDRQLDALESAFHSVLKNHKHGT